jgi:ComF family protein
LLAAGHLLSGLVDLVLPESCLACAGSQSGTDGLCDACSRQLLSLVSMPYCSRCGSTLGPNVPEYDDGCWACPQPVLRVGRVIRLGPYGGPIREIIKQLKYHRNEHLARHMGNLLAEAVTARCDEQMAPDVVIAVPMHWLRRLGRGFDHAQSLARRTAKRLGVTVGDHLVRVRNTPQQVSLSRTRRIENVRNAFAVMRKREIEGATVLLVDDVTTTGATANEAARILLNAGAARVNLAVLAKSEPPRAYADYQQG